MARKLFKRYLPDSAAIKDLPALKFMGTLLHDPNLFHLNRHSVSVGVFVGVFVAFLPILGQMPLAALLAILFRCNLPIAVMLVWISNPFTIPPIFYTTYELGRWILQTEAIRFTLDLDWQWFKEVFPRLWKPLLTGSILTGLLLGFIGYVSVQAFWFWYVLRNWERRKLRKKSKTDNQ